MTDHLLTIKVSALSIIGLLAQAPAPTSGSILEVGEAVGKLGLIGVLIWTVWQQQRRIDDQTSKMETIMETAVTAAAGNREELASIKTEVIKLSKEVDRVASLLENCQGAHNCWKAGDPDRRKD
jgi:hypothetical protein